jgi:hypothetical protein
MSRYKTIKDLVFTYVHEKRGIIDYNKLTKAVLSNSPNSKWKHSHWDWYKHHLLEGKFRDEITNEERRNLESYKKPKGSDLYEPNRKEGTSTLKRIRKINEQKIVKVFPNKLKEEQRIIALSLARLCHHAHPEIVRKIKAINKKEKEKLAKSFPTGVDINDYFHRGSACVFPGVRRFIGRLSKNELLKYVPRKGAIIDDNRMPRHFWTFLVVGQSYSGPTWKNTGLGEFELAHIFSHKTNERNLEQRAFGRVDLSQKPYGMFTCPSNIVLVPKGMAKPTDGLDAVLIAFYKRYIDLYGGGNLPGLRSLKRKMIPKWYGDLEWNEPILPPNWETNILDLLEYRNKRLKVMFSKPVLK